MNCSLLGMESLPQQVCRKLKLLASDNRLWSKLFKARWGEDRAAFYVPNGSKSWKDVFEVQDRCDRVGVSSCHADILKLVISLFAKHGL